MRNLNSLSENTAKVLTILSDLPMMQDFVLVGGTGLALYLNHRLSEDLDFFSNKDIDINQIIIVLNENFASIKTMTISKNQIELLLDNVKVTFCYQNNSLLDNYELLIGNTKLAHIDTIISMKILTVFLRAKLRDYYDLYIYTKKYDLSNLIELGNKNVAGFSTKLFEKSIIFIDDIDDENIDYLNPIENVTKIEIRDYFQLLIKSRYHK